MTRRTRRTPRQPAGRLAGHDEGADAVGEDLGVGGERVGERRAGGELRLRGGERVVEPPARPPGDEPERLADADARLEQAPELPVRDGERAIADGPARGRMPHTRSLIERTASWLFGSRATWL